MNYIKPNALLFVRNFCCMKSHGAALLFATLLTGCAVPYVEPPQGTGALLRLENLSQRASATFATFDDGENCKATTVKRITTDSSGNWEIAPGFKHSIRIKADEAFTLAATGAVPSLRCEALLTFLPKKGVSYVALYNFETVSCSMAIRRIENGALVKEESTRVRTSVAGLLHGGNSCQ